MADTETSWVIKLVDMVTGPIKSVVSGIESMTKSQQKSADAADKLGKAHARSAEDIRTAIEKEKSTQKTLNKELEQRQSMLEQLEDIYSKVAVSAKRGMDAQVADERNRVQSLKDQIAASKGETEKLKKELKGVESAAKDVGKTGGASFTRFTVTLNQGLELVNKLNRALGFATAYQDMKENVARMTDLQGDALTEFSKRAQKIADVYDKSADDVAAVTHRLTQQVGGSYEENFKAIEKGFKIGADVNGNYLQSLDQYAAKFREAGLSAEQGIALITAANKKGVDPSKALDFLAKGTINLKLLKKNQIAALKGIQIDPKDLIGSAPIDAIKMISEKMKGQSAEAKQAIIKALFTDMGTGAGIQFAEEISEIDFDISKYPEVEAAASGMKGFFSDIKTWAAESMGDIPIYIQNIAPLATVLASVIPLMREMKLAQWGINAAMAANPIGVIIAIIAALIAIVVVAINKYDEWGAALLAFLGPVGWLINGIQSLKDHWDSVKKAFTTDGIIGGLKRLHIVLLDAVLKPLQQILELVAKIPGIGGMAQSGIDKIKKFRENNDLVTEGEKNKSQKEEKSSTSLSVNKIVQGEPGLNPQEPEGKKKKKKSGKEDGLSIGGSRGVANIRMTINNYFNVGPGTNVRQLADQVAGAISDRLQDAIVSV